MIQGEKNSSPIFVGGLFKSGTSLLRAMIAQHSRIAGGLETYWFDLPWGEPEPRLEKDIERLRRFFDLDEQTVERIVEQSGSAEEFLNGFMGEVAAKQGKARWVEKTPGNILHLKRIYEFWPSASVIHVIRDPRDVLASLRQARKWDDIETFSNLWCRFFGAVRDFKESEAAKHEASFTEVRYEDLVLHPGTTMKRLLTFVGEDWEDSVSDFQGRPPEYQKVLEITGKASTTLKRLGKPLTQSRVGIWRKVLVSEDLDRLREAVEARGLLPLMEEMMEETLSRIADHPEEGAGEPGHGQ